MSYDAMTQEEIELFFNLDDRLAAVEMMVHARDYIRKCGMPYIDRIQTLTLLSDGIKNALDGRATGFEHRTIRHNYYNERDGPIPPTPRDRRCHHCGAIDPPPFSRCPYHIPAPEAQ